MPSYYERRLDEENVNYTYMGVAPPGSIENDSIWRISRMDEVDGVIRILFAEGTVSFDKVWSLRLTYDYS